MYNKDGFYLINYLNNSTIRTTMAWSVSYMTMRKERKRKKKKQEKKGGVRGGGGGKTPGKRLSPRAGFELLPPKP